MGDRNAVILAWAALGVVGLDRLARLFPDGWATQWRSPATHGELSVRGFGVAVPVTVAAELARLQEEVNRLGRELEAAGRRGEPDEVVIPLFHAALALAGASSWTPWLVHFIAWCAGRQVVYRRPVRTRF